MNHTFDDATMDLPVALILIAAAVAATLVIGIAAVVHQNRAKAARRVTTTGKPWTRRACDCTGCGCTGWIPTLTHKDGSPVDVCSGHYAEGRLRGWWQCDVEGCRQSGAHVVERKSGSTLLVCTDCRDEGTVLGYWDTEVAS